ncbi:MAG: hypothetical protein ABIK81_01265 [candidate division WOR-3 bacterium]
MLLVIYLFTNSLFLSKYLPRFTNNYPYLIIFYIILILLFFSLRKKIIKIKPPRYFFFIFSLLLAFLIFLLLKGTNPRDFRVGRYLALWEWNEKFLKGIFPYGGPTRPSGFPFLFLFSLPFYLLGDLGLLQIFGFLLFTYLLSSKKGNFFGTILLILSPVFLFEVITRSELFTNLTLILAYLLLYQKKEKKIKEKFLLPYGILGGFFLATRGIVLFPYLLFFPFHFKGEWRKGLIFLLGLSIGFLSLNLPFLLWDKECFIKEGPFSIQTAYLPNWLLPFLLFFSFLAIRIWRREDSYPLIAFFLFFIVCVSFLLALINYGFSALLFQSRFDISYFIFPFPFLLYSLTEG